MPAQKRSRGEEEEDEEEYEEDCLSAQQQQQQKLQHEQEPDAGRISNLIFFSVANTSWGESGGED